jgi:hypothetical protein
MRLKQFNSSSRYKHTLPSIGVDAKRGKWKLNGVGSKLIGLQPGDEVQILQDQDEPGNWYIEKVIDNGFKVRADDKLGLGVVFNNRGLARAINDELPYCRILIAGEPTIVEGRTIWGLIRVPKE